VWGRYEEKSRNDAIHPKILGTSGFEEPLP
jgi:hypothetical protein